MSTKHVNLVKFRLTKGNIINNLNRIFNPSALLAAVSRNIHDHIYFFIIYFVFNSLAFWSLISSCYLDQDACWGVATKNVVLCISGECVLCKVGIDSLILSLVYCLFYTDRCCFENLESINTRIMVLMLQKSIRVYSN